ncbi:MAG: hypothetical protein DRP00_01820 [Candidatus Aenigmatarchaeota archaeon]|nr:MAG: hypothetical protein DRP00_01820 [Candidatus Aenigmarchaeota archaeon]
MVSGKSIIKYFLAGGFGTGTVTFILAYLPIPLYVPYLSMVFSLTGAIGTLIAGLILDLIWKD